MIAEESAKWATAFTGCKTKRELDALLRKISLIENVPIQPGRESYGQIATSLGFGDGTALREGFESALARLHLHQRS